MDWPAYKALCERPDVMPRAMLARTEALLPPALAAGLRALQAQTPYPKPSDHKGDAATDMLPVSLRAGDADAILAAVEAAAATGGATRGLVAAWGEVKDHFAAGEADSRTAR